jgi:hypothetical protein
MIAALRDLAPGELVSVDVFDTLLLRRPLSERRRMSLAAAVFAERPGLPRGLAAATVLHARLEAQRFAYRALDLGRNGGEVRIESILERQLALLGLPRTLLAALLRVEIDIEKAALRADRQLCEQLATLRARGRRTIAVSDTALPGWAVAELDPLGERARAGGAGLQQRRSGADQAARYDLRRGRPARRGRHRRVAPPG